MTDANVAEEELPTIDFSTFVLSISQSAMMHLGDVPQENLTEGMTNMTMARQSIELLVLLEEKTKGNLTGDEERLLHQQLDELRMRFYDMTRKAKTS